MANLDLTGQIPVEIDHVYSITCTRVSVRESVPTSFKAGAFGPIGIGQGIGPVEIELSFAVPKAGLEFDINDLKRKPNGFTVSLAVSTVDKYAYVGCRVSNKGLSGDPQAGNSELTMSLMGTEEVEL